MSWTRDDGAGARAGTEIFLDRSNSSTLFAPFFMERRTAFFLCHREYWGKHKGSGRQTLAVFQPPPPPVVWTNGITTLQRTLHSRGACRRIIASLIKGHIRTRHIPHQQAHGGLSAAPLHDAGIHFHTLDWWAAFSRCARPCCCGAVIVGIHRLALGETEDLGHTPSF